MVPVLAKAPSTTSSVPACKAPATVPVPLMRKLAAWSTAVWFWMKPVPVPAAVANCCHTGAVAVPEL